MKYKIGLTLSGGGARGIAHLGIIKALEENNIYPEIISGASMGSIIGCLYCSGLSVEEILDIFEEERLSKVFSIDLGKLGVLRHSFLFGVIERHLNIKSFKELKKPLYVSVTNLNKGTNEVFYEGNLKEIIVASSAIPIVFKPVVIDKTWYVDGGLTDNLPAKAIRKKCSFLIGSHVNYKPYKSDFSGFKDIAERSFRIAIYNTIKEGKEMCDFFFDPPKIREYSTFDLNKYKEIYEIGYEHAKEKINNEKLLNKINPKKFWNIF